MHFVSAMCKDNEREVSPFYSSFRFPSLPLDLFLDISGITREIVWTFLWFQFYWVSITHLPYTERELWPWSSESIEFRYARAWQDAEFHEIRFRLSLCCVMKCLTHLFAGFSSHRLSRWAEETARKCWAALASSWTRTLWISLPSRWDSSQYLIAG